jgi:isoquinoline 1-oxidoreductase beta subunit
VNALLDRRAFLRAGAQVTGALWVGLKMPAARANGHDAPFAPNAFVRIDRQGQTTLVMPQVEMGQGTYLSISMILAEELDAAFDRVSVEHAPPDNKLYANPLLGIQATGGSTSIRAFWKPLREAAAAARALLVQAAAEQWRVPADSLRTADSQVLHEASGRRVDYGALIARAQQLTPPKNVALKSHRDFKLIGKPLPRMDTPGKVNGKVIYSIDAQPPGVKFAVLSICPVFGGKVGQVDDTRAKEVPGVRQVLQFDDFVAVVGDHTWAAKQGLEALQVTWNEGALAHLTTADIFKQARAASEKPGVVAKNEGDARAKMQEGESFDGVYELPFLAHATMEPLNCTAHVTPSGCEVWVGSQVLARAQTTAAAALGIPPEKVTVHQHLIGGGFGRRLETDFIDRSVRVAQRVASPVKVTYTREQDIQHDIVRPIYVNRLSASVKDGRIVAWTHRVTGASILARWLPPAFQKGIDIDAVDCATQIPYEVAHFHVDYVRDEPPGVPVGFWRGVGPNSNVFAIETFMDELAHKHSQDPVAFRRAHLEKAPRYKAALELVAEQSGWGKPLPPRVGRGVSLSGAFGSYLATVVELEVDAAGEVRLRRVVSAVDTGIIINPDTVVAQLQGGIVFGLTAALYGRIDIDRGRVQQSNFHDYRMLRINQVPEIEVHLIQSEEMPGGIGEAGTTSAPPAFTNALFAATGVRFRNLPIDQALLARKKS